MVTLLWPSPSTHPASARGSTATAETEDKNEDRLDTQGDERVKRLVAVTLVLLAAYIAFAASVKLWQREHPEPSLVGILVTVVPLGVMWGSLAQRGGPPTPFTVAHWKPTRFRQPLVGGSRSSSSAALG